MPVKNFEFKDGLMWLPVKQPIISDPLPPLYAGGDTGSLMPYLAFEIPGLFDYLVLPYENILDFEYSVFGGSSSGTAVVNFVDSTPLFIETILRTMLNKRHNTKDFVIKMDYGWRISNPTTGIKPFITGDKENAIGSGVFSSGTTDFLFLDTTYKYSTHGVLASIKMRAKTTHLLATYKINKKTTLPDIKGKDDLQNKLSSFINENIDNKEFPYRVIVESENIRYDKLIKAKLAFEAGESLQSALSKVLSNLYIPPHQKDEKGSALRFHVSHRTSTETTLDKNQNQIRQEFVPIFIYDEDDEDKLKQYIPLIEYPSNETPITSFSPTMSLASKLFLNSDRYTVIDDLGNQVTLSKAIEAQTAGVNSTPDKKQDNNPNKGKPDSEKLNLPGSRNNQTSINISMMGDPTFSTETLRYSWVEVRMNEIVNDSVLRNKEDYFSNFPQVPAINTLYGKSFRDPNNPAVQEASKLVSRGLLPKVKGIPGDISPFNGIYRIYGATHKINQSDGFATELELGYKASTKGDS
jgi:hypothetical protein